MEAEVISKSKLAGMIAVVALLSALPVAAAFAATDASAAPQPEVKGRTYTIGEGADAIPVLEVWGTPYEMGFAHGRIMADAINDSCATTMAAMLTGMGKKPEEVDAVYRQQSPFIPEAFKEEMKGVADGAGVPVEQIQRLNTIPDLSEYHCSYFAAWGRAVDDGHLYQIRALDYEMEAGIQRHPLLVVYAPTEGNGLVNVTWAGMIGVISGMNEQKLAASEIGDNFGADKETLDGEPMPFVLREVLQYCDTLDQAVRLIQNSKRTSSYHYCVGDAKANNGRGDARGFVTCKSYCQVQGPDDQPHPKHLADVVYMSFGLDTPEEWPKGRNAKLYERLLANYGHLNPQVAATDIMRNVKTGDLHAVVYNVSDLKLWVANAEGTSPAYTREYIGFNFGASIHQFRKYQ
jgi:isopenicillin-N N-acyltransferase-like protein